MKCFWWIRRKSVGRFPLENWPELVYMLTGSHWLLYWENAIAFFFLLMAKEPQLIHKRHRNKQRHGSCKYQSGETICSGNDRDQMMNFVFCVKKLGLSKFLPSVSVLKYIWQRFFSNSVGFYFTVLTVSFILHNLM